MKYLVWIGGIYNEFTTFEEAVSEQANWLNKGYDDVVIEAIEN